jgi:hypothetical protein
MNIPNNLTAGDSAQWDDEAIVFNGERYDSAMYSLAYELRGPKQMTVNAVAYGQGWRSTIAPADAANLTAGTYWWASIVTGLETRLTVGSGQLQVLPDLAAVAADGYDGRSLAEKSLADAEAALADLTKSGKRVKKYAIGSRNTEYYTAAELMTAIDYWRARVSNEQTAKSIANGLGNPRTLLVRFR